MLLTKHVQASLTQQSQLPSQHLINLSFYSVYSVNGSHIICYLFIYISL